MLSNPFKSLRIKTVTLLYMDRTSFNLKMVLLQLASLGIPYFRYARMCAVFKSKCHLVLTWGVFSVFVYQNMVVIRLLVSGE